MHTLNACFVFCVKVGYRSYYVDINTTLFCVCWEPYVGELLSSLIHVREEKDMLLQCFIIKVKYMVNSLAAGMTSVAILLTSLPQNIPVLPAKVWRLTLYYNFN